jgi:hypothetical protein
MDELVDVGVAALVDLVGLALPDDPALVDHGDVVGDLAGRRHVVGDRDGGGAEPLDAVDDEIVDDVGHDRVEAGRGLVEEDDLGVGGDGAGEADALLHAARQLGREQLGDVGAEAHLLQLVERDVLGLVARHLAALDQAEGDVLPDGKGIEQGRALEQHAEAREMAVALLALQPDDLLAADADRARIGPDEAENRLDHHRLAGARAADHHHGMAAAH